MLYVYIHLHTYLVNARNDKGLPANNYGGEFPEMFRLADLASERNILRSLYYVL
jgi:hypothetical protein